MDKNNSTNGNIIDDIDDLKSKVESFEISEDQFNLLKDILLVVYEAVESSLSGIVIIDNDSNITYSNPAFRKMLGYSKNEKILGRKISDFFPSEEIKNFSVT